MRLDSILEIKRIKLIFVISIILFGAFLRLYNLEADPDRRIDGDLGLFTDEGLYGLAARNLALFGEFNPNQKSKVIEAVDKPIYTYSIYMSLKFFGVNIKSLRYPSIFVSILILIIAYLLMNKIFGQITGLLTLGFLSFSHMFIQYNRLALLENLICLFILLSVYTYLLGKNRMYSLIFSGIFYGCAIITKGTAYLFLPGLLIIIYLEGHKMGSLKEGIKALGYFTLSMALVTMVNEIYIYFIIKSGLIRESMNRISLISHGLNLLYFGSLGDIIKKISQILLSKFSINIPLIFLLAYVYSLLFLATIKKPFTDKKRCILLFILWFTLGFLFLSFFSYQPNRYRVPLIIPLCSLAAIALNKLLYLQQKEMILKKNNLWWVIVGGGTLIMVFRILRVVMVSLNIQFENNFILIISILTSMTFILWIWRYKDIKIKLNYKKIVVIIIILLSLSYDGINYWNWSKNPVYNIATGNKKIKQMIDSGVIGGQYAAILGFTSNNILIPLHYKKNLEGLRDLDLTHYLDAVKHKPNFDYLKVKMINPHFLEGAKLIEEFQIGFTIASLYQLSKAN